jgi:hypothetical protein
MGDETKQNRPDCADDNEISEEVLQWISGGSHGCPGCPHPTMGPGIRSGCHILADGSIFEDGALKRKL